MAHIRNQDGFTFVEIMISGLIMVVIALGIAQLMQSTNKQEVNIKVKQEAFSYQQHMRYERKVVQPAPTDGP